MEIYLTRAYRRALIKLIKKKPDYIEVVEKRIYLLKNSPNHPRLRLHKLSNKENEYSISVDYSVRIIFSREKDTCYLLDIGAHDDVY